jgi:hypothetical protein
VLGHGDDMGDAARVATMSLKIKFIILYIFYLPNLYLRRFAGPAPLKIVHELLSQTDPVFRGHGATGPGIACC